ncbi:ferredoxin [Smaragdicoccus niigatensis]|uniref:ferredoxin n=1 Tax=Smaragdicoccus niigatensis TaxID=359359 RepID=UPI000373F7C3|nr:ferredoxin [Smaragdicoccus niigatensis]
MKIVADLSKCDGHGMCEAMSEIFEVGADGFVHILNESPDEADRKYVLAAVEACPVMALSVQQ